MNTIIRVTLDNLVEEHLCCAFADRSGDASVSNKKQWLTNRITEGLVFKKLNVRGRVFIEYLPAENAWRPIVAPGYMHINCFWVAGQYQGKGYGKLLLAECIKDSRQKGCMGIIAVTGMSKQPFLTDGDFLKQQGFLVADTAHPYFQLLYLPFTTAAVRPMFNANAKSGTIDQQGVVLYYTAQCPYSEPYALELKKQAAGRNITVTLRKITSRQQAQNAPAAVTSYALFHQGKFVTNAILTGARIQQFLESI